MFDNKSIQVKNTNFCKGGDSSASAIVNNYNFGESIKKTQEKSRFITCKIDDEVYKNLFEGQEPYYLEETLEDKVIKKNYFEPHKEDKEKLIEEKGKILKYDSYLELSTKDFDNYAWYYKVYKKIKIKVIQVSVIAMNTLLVEVKEEKEEEKND